MNDPAPQTKSELRERLRQLGLALLNATLLLAVLLIFGLWLLLGRVEHFAAETVGALSGEIGHDLKARLAAGAEGVIEIQDRLHGLEETVRIRLSELDAAGADSKTAGELAALRAEIDALRSDLGALTHTLASLRAHVSGSLHLALEQVLRDLAAIIRSLPLADPTPTGASP